MGQAEASRLGEGRGPAVRGAAQREGGEAAGEAVGEAGGWWLDSVAPPSGWAQDSVAPPVDCLECIWGVIKYPPPPPHTQERLRLRVIDDPLLQGEGGGWRLHILRGDKRLAGGCGCCAWLRVSRVVASCGESRA